MILEMTLDNGLEAIVKENHRVPLIILQVFVKTGSIHEGKQLGTGISHVLEHIIYKGPTINRTEEVVNNTLEALGNSANAYTTNDHTSYYIIVSKNHFDAALELMTDCMMNSFFQEDRFHRELGVIQREIEQGEDDLGKILWQLSIENMFRVHPIRFPVIGYKNSLKMLTFQEVKTYYETTYITNNMIFVVVGDINAQEAIRKIKAAFDGFKRKRELLHLFPEEPPQTGKRTLIKEMNTEMARMNIGFRTISLFDPQRYPLEVLSSLLGAGNNSLLSRINRPGEELAASISSASFTPYYVPGYFMITSILKPSSLEAAKEKILKVLFHLKTTSVKDDDLKRAKKQKISQYLFKNQTLRDEALELGANALGTFDPCFARDYLNNIENVTSTQIQEVAESFFKENALSVTIIKPLSKKSSKSAKKTGPAESPIEKVTLPNGMILLLKEDHRTPLVSLQAYFKGGVLYENRSNNGISYLLARMLLRGSKSYSSSKMYEIIESDGGRISAQSGKNTFFIRCELLNTEIKKNLEILSDIIKAPLFSVKEMDIQKSLMINSIRREYQSWEAELANFFRQIFFKKSPYGLNSLGSEKSVTAITQNDLLEFYRRYVIPDNLVMSVFGDINADDVRTIVEEMFGDFTSDNKFENPCIPAEDPLLENETIIKTHEKNMASVCIGFPGIKISNLRDRFPLQVLEGILSGVNYPGGRLHKELREKKLVYSVKSINFMGIDPGSFEIISATRPEMVEEVIGIILENVKKLKTCLVEEDDLKKGKVNAIMAYLVEMQKVSYMAADAALYELYGIDYNFPQTYPQHIEEVTNAEVQRIANTYFSHYKIAVLTPGGK